MINLVKSAPKASLFILLLGSATPVPALTINPIYDVSVTNSGMATSIKAGFNSAIQFFQNTYSDPISININVYWGAAGPFSADPGTGGGASFANWMTGFSYNTVYNALTNDAKSTADRTSISSGTVAPANPSPLGSSMLSSAEAKALSVAFAYANSYWTNFPANNLTAYGATNNVDGWVSFGSSSNWFFDQSSPVATLYDFVGTAEHEISEVLGRVTFIGQTNFFPYTLPYDLFRYSAPNVRTFNPSSGTAYFSYDNGTNNIMSFNTVAANGDLADWSSPTNDAYYYGDGRGLLNITPGDIATLDVIGYDLVPEPGTATIWTAATVTIGYVSHRRRKRRSQRRQR